MLYILSCSPYLCNLVTLSKLLKKNDNLILFSDGVLAGVVNSFALKLLNFNFIKIYALENDIIARGLSNYFSHNIFIINYIDFVTITEKKSPLVNWIN